MPVLQPSCERRQRSWRRYRHCRRRRSVDLLPCRRARARASQILARPLPPTEPRGASLAERQLHPAHCHSTDCRGRCGDDGGGGEAGDSGREREAMEEEEEKLISWVAVGRAAGMRSALSARPLRRRPVAATVTNASLTKPTTRTSMARPPPRLAARARLCTRPDGGRPRTRPTSLGAPPQVQIKGLQPFSALPPPESPDFQYWGDFVHRSE